MEPEGRARSGRQVEAEHQKPIVIGQEHLELQALLIGLRDAVPMRQFRKKKTHDLADAPGLAGAEIAVLELKARQALARKRDIVTLDCLKTVMRIWHCLEPPRPGACRGVPRWYYYHFSPSAQHQTAPASYLRGLTLRSLLLSFNCFPKNLPFTRHLQGPPG